MKWMNTCKSKRNLSRFDDKKKRDEVDDDG